MMTAANIAKGLGIGKIKVNYLYSELLGDNLFEQCPMKHTLIRNKDPKYLVEHYLEGVEFEDSETFKSEAHELYPESKSMGRERSQLILQDFAKNYSKSDKKVAHLAISHGFFVNQFALNLNGYSRSSAYCAISGAVIKGDRATLILDSYCDHVLTW